MPQILFIKLNLYWTQNIILHCHFCIQRVTEYYISTAYMNIFSAHISTEVLPSVLWESLCFLTFTQALTVVIHSDTTHLLVSQCFERTTPFTTVTPATFSPVMAEQRCIGWWALWKRRNRNHTQVHTQNTHTRSTLIPPVTLLFVHHRGDLIHILCAIMAWKRKLCPRAVDGIAVSQ